MRVTNRYDKFKVMYSMVFLAGNQQIEQETKAMLLCEKKSDHHM